MKRLLLALALALGVTAPAQGATLVRLNGVGPLKLGMSRMAALDTGWLSNKKPGCELAGPPRPVDYDLAGSQAPDGLEGGIEFTGGKATNMAFTAGVRTSAGVVPGKTTWAGMVRRYRDAGAHASARYIDTFGGTFVTVKLDGTQVMGGFADKKIVTVIGIPFVPVCE
ncbi:MAG: hypothetical protein JWR35_3908 [Marmoricola sp.]|nr:hypothetical protein [Marmoricola sp.]